MSLWARFSPFPWSGLWSSPKGFSGSGVGGGTVIYPNEFCFCLLTCNETWENNLNGSIRKDTGHLSGFLSRAIVNSWNVKMRGRGDWGQSPRFFLILSSVFSLGCSPCQKLWKLFFYVWDTFCIWIWWKINDKRGVVSQAYKKRMKVLILKLMGSTVTILFMSLWRATRIRAFPKNAVIDKKVLMTERKTSSPCTSPVNSTEQ